METIKDESGLQRRKNIVCRVQIQNLIVDVIVDAFQENVALLGYGVESVLPNSEDRSSITSSGNRSSNAL